MEEPTNPSTRSVPAHPPRTRRVGLFLLLQLALVLLALRLALNWGWIQSADRFSALVFVTRNFAIVLGVSSTLGLIAGLLARRSFKWGARVTAALLALACLGSLSQLLRNHYFLDARSLGNRIGSLYLGDLRAAQDETIAHYNRLRASGPRNPASIRSPTDLQARLALADAAAAAARKYLATRQALEARYAGAVSAQGASPNVTAECLAEFRGSAGRAEFDTAAEAFYTGLAAELHLLDERWGSWSIDTENPLGVRFDTPDDQDRFAVLRSSTNEAADRLPK